MYSDSDISSLRANSLKVLRTQGSTSTFICTLASPRAIERALRHDFLPALSSDFRLGSRLVAFRSLQSIILETPFSFAIWFIVRYSVTTPV